MSCDCFIIKGSSGGLTAAEKAAMQPMENCQFKPFLVAASGTTLTVKANSNIKLINSGVHSIYASGTSDVTLTVADLLDTGAIEAGKDYYVYLCAGNVFVVSLNSTYPAGYDADSSRKIGGFHTLCVSAGTIASHPASGFVAGDIIPNSVWCLNFSSKGQQEGHVYLSHEYNFLNASFPTLFKYPLWKAIYLQSGTGVNTISSYGGTITDTRVDGWHGHVEDLAAVGDRLMRDHEFAIGAEGCNQKTNISGSADPVTTGGHSDTDGRRMISNYFTEDDAGAMWQWLETQSYRYDMDAAPALTALSQTNTVYDIASPGGNPIYLKFTSSGMPYLCSNLAVVAAPYYLPMSTTHKLQITHDASASDGIQVYIKKANSILDRLVCVVPTAKDAYLPTSSPELWVKVKYDASAATNVAINFDDTDQRLEANMTNGNTTIDLGAMAPTWGNQDLGSNKGSLYRQGTYGDTKLFAGGNWASGANCGPRCRYAYYQRWNANATLGGRGCAEPA